VLEPLQTVGKLDEKFGKAHPFEGGTIEFRYTSEAFVKAVVPGVIPTVFDPCLFAFMSMKKAGSNGAEQKGSGLELKNIPTELQAKADEAFARGKSIFIWDVEKGAPLKLESNFPAGLRQIGYAFAPTSAVARFAVAGEVIRHNAEGKLSRVNVVYPGPDKPFRVGVEMFPVTCVAGEELSQGMGLNLVNGEGKATFAVVPFGTIPDEAPKTVLSNEIMIPIKIKRAF
jgi:hypothetical protein